MTRRKSNPEPSKPKRPRGRPTKRVAPAKPATAAAAPAAVPPAAPATFDPTASLRAMAQASATRQNKGERLAHHEAKALREAWLLDQAIHLWPSKEAACAELSVSMGTLATYADQGCPGIPRPSAGDGNAPIPKALVYAWLLRTDRGAGGPHANTETVEEQDARYRRLRADRMEGTMVAEAEDRARAALISLVGQIRHELIHAWPAAVVDLLCEAVARTHRDGADAGRTALANLDRAALESAISQWADARAHDLPHDLTPTPTPDPA